MKWATSVRQGLDRMSRAWNGFWFAPEDPLSLGVLRVLVGGLLVYTHFVWGLNLEGFFGPDGWQSTEAVRGYFADDWLPSIWWYVPVEHLRLVHVLCLVPLVLFAVGLFTPVTSVLALVITISNSNRALLANYGMDQILSLLMLYLTIGGCGDRFSLDAWRRQRAARRELGSNDVDWRPAATSRARLGTRLIQVHFCVIYFFSAISKLQGEAWWNGDAVWMAFANKEYQSIDMTWLARYPWVTQLATHATIYWELSFPFLIWNRTLRPFLLLMGIGLHAGIGLCMGMITFGSIMIFGYFAFVPPERIQSLLDWANRRHTLRRPTSAVPSPLGANNRHVRSADDAPKNRDEAPALALQAKSYNMSRRRSPVAVEPNDAPLAICDPSWKHRDFATYLSKRGFRPFVSTSPARVWMHVERHDLHGAILFVDRLTAGEFALLLDDLTLSPISELPIVVAAQRESRRRRADALGLRHLNTMALPAAFRDLRAEIEVAISTAAGGTCRCGRVHSVEGDGRVDLESKPKHLSASSADSTGEPTR